MSELKFTGAATLTGFPRDKAFGFEIEGDRLILKAGKEIFLIVEKEAAPEAVINVAPADIGPVVYTNLPPAVAHKALDTALGGLPIHPPIPVPAPTGLTYQGYAAPVLGAAVPGGAALTPEHVQGQEVDKPKRQRGPNVTIDESQRIVVSPSQANNYSKLRGAYFDTLRTANGRAVSWWKATPMVTKLEGNAITMLKFFLSEGVVTLQPDPDAAAPTPLQQAMAAFPQAQPAQPNVVPLQPGGFPQPQQPAHVAGPIWTPPVQPGQTPPGGGSGPTFM